MLWNSPLSSFKFGLQTGSKRLKSLITEMWLSLWVRGSYTIEVARPKNKMSRCWRRPPQWDFLRSSWVHYFFPPDTENNFLNAIVNRLTTKCLISKKPFQQTQTWLIYIKTKTKQKTVRVSLVSVPSIWQIISPHMDSWSQTRALPFLQGPPHYVTTSATNSMFTL